MGDVPPAEMPLYFQAADVGVSLARSDSAARSVQECLACGTPVVVADIPQLRERLADVPAVRLVQSAAAEVADALSGLMTQRDEPRLRSSARAWAEANADYRVGRRRLGAVYEELAAPRLSRA